MSLSRAVIGCAQEVHRYLGPGYLESVYDNALAEEFSIRSIRLRRQVRFRVPYKRICAGTFLADFVVEGKLTVELKASKTLTPACQAQLLNYLIASGMQVGLLLNFGASSLQVKRMVNQHDERIVI